MSNRWPLHFMIGFGEQKIQPVWVRDVANGILNIVLHPQTDGEMYYFAGPEVSTQAEVTDWLEDCIGRKRPKVYVPHVFAKMAGKAFEYAPPNWRFFTSDEVTQTHYDLVLPEDPNILTLKDLGVEPAHYKMAAGSMAPAHRGKRSMARHGMTDTYMESELQNYYNRAPIPEFYFAAKTTRIKRADGDNKIPYLPDQPQK